jgi:hypothetical protein
LGADAGVDCGAHTCFAACTFLFLYSLTLNDLVVIRSFGGQIDQGDEAASAEEDKGWKIEAEVEGYGS